VQVLVGTSKPNRTLADKAVESVELSRVFAKHNLKYFYVLDDVTISFEGQEQSQGRVLSLPKDRSARFVYSGQNTQHHVLEFSLPDYEVIAQLRVPEARIFYQAGIKHDGGMIILKMRLNPFKK
jgi:hypothetical protein